MKHFNFNKFSTNRLSPWLGLVATGLISAVIAGCSGDSSKNSYGSLSADGVADQALPLRIEKSLGTWTGETLEGTPCNVKFSKVDQSNIHVSMTVGSDQVDADLSVKYSVVNLEEEGWTNAKPHPLSQGMQSKIKEFQSSIPFVYHLAYTWGEPFFQLTALSFPVEKGKKLGVQLQLPRLNRFSEDKKSLTKDVAWMTVCIFENQVK